MHNDWIALFVILPLAGGIITTALCGNVVLQRIAGLLVLGATGLTAVLLGSQLSPEVPVLVSFMGGWQPPYGIAIALDGVSATLIGIANIVAIAAYFHSFSTLSPAMERRWFHPLFHLLILGVNFSFITGDLFNLFVAFEIMLMASYALIVLGGGRAQMSQAYKYVVLNLVGSTVFVLTAGLLYGIVGTLNYADLARIVSDAKSTGAALPTGFQTLSVMMLFVFALKGAVFPLWFWLPDTYHTMPSSISALFAALLSKVGVYAVLRLFPSVFASPGAEGLTFVNQILPIAAGLTMLIAIGCALSAMNVRRILAMVLIAHVGYLIFGITLMRPMAFAATLHYMGQEMIVMAGLMLCCGVIEKRAGSMRLDELGGLAKSMPGVATMFFVLMIGLIGVPPLAGFYGKALLLREGIGAGSWGLVSATVFTAVLTLVVMLRIWVRAFWGESNSPGFAVPEGAEAGPSLRYGFAMVGISITAVASVGYGFAAEPTLAWATYATRELDNPQEYMFAVLGDRAPAAQPTAAIHKGMTTHEMKTIAMEGDQ